MSGDRLYCPDFPDNPLKPGERGAVAILGTPKMKRGRIRWGEIDYLHLRTAALFFDRVVYPNSASNPRVDLELSSLDFISYAEMIFDTDYDWTEKPSDILDYCLETFNSVSPGQWVVSRHGENSVGLSNVEPGAGFVISAYSALPIFDRETPIDSILEFKLRRKAELLRLRHEIEQVGDVISREGAAARASLHAIERFDQGLADYRRAMRETNWRIDIAHLDLKFNWTDFVPVVSTGLAGVIAGLPLSSLVGTLVGGTALSLGISSGVGLRRKRSAGPFDFLTRVSRELH